ncbi:Efflux ABC transporter, ATP-binding protein [hydrothermal vent metagenome]|uniref:Efflux ABC transporter, ATP-binding protein n=1 Tax=hydrothermal vent metagenome TaxID=652676 RepID=A0A3B1BT46_9ZZZZ
MIYIDGVTKAFGSTVAVDRLTLHVKPGECFGFLGPNGAGKTTTLKMLAGLLTPTKGALTISGFDIQKNPVEAKKIIGYVPDKPFIYEKLTGREFLEFIRDIYRVNGDSKVIDKQSALLDMFSLSGWLDELVETYSHGMRQKLIITAALIHNPKVIIIDEPMVGLDAKGMRQVKGLFREVADSGNTVLLSTHTMAVAQEICDRIAILSKGKVIAIGTIDELRANAGSERDDLESIFLELTKNDE